LSLQFQPATGYFSMVPPRAIPGVIWWVSVAVLVGCGERDRLTFPTADPGNGAGPVTNIDDPQVGDTVLTAGDPFVIAGRTFDPDGVDRVFFQLSGVDQNFAPLDGGGADTVRFGLPILTGGHSGDTVIVQVHGVDLLGQEGSHSVRRLRIR
jgi:hypothetical protein